MVSKELEIARRNLRIAAEELRRLEDRYGQAEGLCPSQHSYQFNEVNSGRLYRDGVKISGSRHLGDCHCEYTSLDKFLASEDYSDLDLNLVVRWDWVTYTAEYTSEPEKLGNTYLLILKLHQRKGNLSSTEVFAPKTPENMLKVQDYLRKRFDRLMSMWYPVSPWKEDEF